MVTLVVVYLHHVLRDSQIWEMEVYLPLLFIIKGRVFMVTPRDGVEDRLSGIFRIIINKNKKDNSIIPGF